MLWLIFPEDLNEILGGTHTGYFGSKKEWVNACWDVIEKRCSDESIWNRKYILPPPSLTLDESTEKQPSASSSASTWLASGVQMVVGDSMPGEGNTINFPKEKPVEEANQTNPEEADEDSENEKSSLEQDMERWVEMVDGVNMLNRIDWLTNVVDNEENWKQLDKIFMEGMSYCKKFQDRVLLPWNVSDWPRNPRLWLGEMERVLQVMSFKRQIPHWLHRPHDRYIRNDASEAAAGFSDPGNYTLDVIVHALRLWNYCEASRAERVIYQPISEYGASANKSAKGPVNLRGNIIEAMTKCLQKTGSEGRSRWGEYDPMEYWYWEGWYKKPEADAARAYWQSTSWSSQWSARPYHGR